MVYIVGSYSERAHPLLMSHAVGSALTFTIWKWVETQTLKVHIKVKMFHSLWPCKAVLASRCMWRLPPFSSGPQCLQWLDCKVGGTSSFLLNSIISIYFTAHLRHLTSISHICNKCVLEVTITHSCGTLMILCTNAKYAAVQMENCTVLKSKAPVMLVKGKNLHSHLHIQQN